MKARAVTAATRYQTTVLYGPSGGGKSTLAATAPSPIILDSNKGLLSIAGRAGFEAVRSVDVSDMKDLEDAYQQCKTGDWSGKFKTIVFDHFDDIQDLVLNELGEKGVERDDRRDPDETQMREWGIMGSRLRRYLRKFKAIKMHKILICGEKEDRETGRMAPALVGALKSQLPYFADHTFYLKIGKAGKRFLCLDPTDAYYAKTRAWWIAQRKYPLPFSDTTALTTLFAAIAAGPKSASRGAAEDA